MTNKQKKIIRNTISYVKSSLKDAEGGHDWWHTYRVLKVTRVIAAEEKANLFICELGALLHDIADPKFHEGDEIKGSIIASEFLKGQGLDSKIITSVTDIIKKISYKGGIEKAIGNSLELKVVQDADRLDAMGAIGIARAFHFGGFSKRKIYDPDITPRSYSSAKEYRSSDSPTINHFYEKLLLLKDLMNTPAGKKMAENRHRFLKDYLHEFYDEWNGKR